MLENKVFGGYWKIKGTYEHSKGLMRGFIKIIHKGFQIETSSYLPLHTKIDGPLNLPHGSFGVFISGDARIGKNCTIYQQVTIGSNMLIDSRTYGAPTIGDNCIIGAGAKIIGNVRIGNNCRIGANCTVTKNIPDNATVVLNDPKIIIKKNPVNKVYMRMKSGWGYTVDGTFVLETDSKILEILNRNNNQ